MSSPTAPGPLPRRPADLADTRALVWRPTPTGYRADGRPASGQRVVARVPLSTERARRMLLDSCGRTTRPRWSPAHGGVWLVARAHFRVLVTALTAQCGPVAVCVDLTTTRACGTWCRDAVGDECDCSCMGQNHAAGTWSQDWTAVSDEWVVAHRKVRRWFRSGAAPAGPAALVPVPRDDTVSAGSVGRRSGPTRQGRSEAPIPIRRNVAPPGCPECGAHRLTDCASSTVCGAALDPILTTREIAR